MPDIKELIMKEIRTQLSNLTLFFFQVPPFLHVNSL